MGRTTAMLWGSLRRLVSGMDVMELSRKLLFTAAIVVLFASTAGAEIIVGAQYATPAARYDHFALGQAHEFARVRVKTALPRIAS